MTCIVALSDGKTVWLGGDAAGTTGDEISIRSDAKVSVQYSGGVFWGIGFTTSYRMGQLIRYHVTLPKVTSADKTDLFKYVVTKFIPHLRTVLSDGGFASLSEGTEEGGQFILALLGKIFMIDSDFQVGAPIENFYAVGSGGSCAKGALHGLQQFKESKQIAPERQVLAALKTSENFCASVRAPFTIVTVPFDQKIPS
jgi:ATP-dependent protease HslVU (ClpYQ) peptidase subunit